MEQANASEAQLPNRLNIDSHLLTATLVTGQSNGRGVVTSPRVPSSAVSDHTGVGRTGRITLMYHRLGHGAGKILVTVPGRAATATTQQQGGTECDN